MDIRQTITELFEPTFEAIGDSELEYGRKRALLYNMYCFACAIYPEYVAAPSDTLFEYGCCFLIEPDRHPDYKTDPGAFDFSAGAADAIPGGGRKYSRRGKDFIKYDYGSKLFERLSATGVIPPDDREDIPSLSLYAAVYLCCNMFPALRPLWFVYYFYLDATNEPIDEEYDEKLYSLLHDTGVYAAAMEVTGSMLIGDEAELGAGKLLDFYAPFIEYRRKHIFDVFEKRMNKGDYAFVADYSTELLKCYPENVGLMNWNAAARTERIVRDKDGGALDSLIFDLREYSAASNSEVVKKYLKLAVLMRKNLAAGGM